MDRLAQETSLPLLSHTVCYLLKTDFFLNVYECLPACMYMHHIHGLVPSDSTKKVMDPQELELQMVVSHS